MRLIDADALFEVIEKSMAENPHKEKTQRAMHIHEHKYFLTLLTTFPTIQPEERTDKHTETHACDCISRKDAIRWIKTECNPYGKPTLDFESGKRVMKHLEKMPSAQPDQKWIPVSERLPEEGGEYLTSVYHIVGPISVFHPENDTYVSDVAIMKFYDKFPSTVRAWMPLPEPYKEGETI